MEAQKVLSAPQLLCPHLSYHSKRKTRKESPAPLKTSDILFRNDLQEIA